MPSTYSTRNRAEKQAAGENSNTWGTRLNTNTIDIIDAALDGRVAFTLSGAKTLTTVDGAADEARMRFIDVTGGTGGTVTIPNLEKLYLVRNGSTGDLTFTTGSGTTATIKSGNVQWIVSAGGNVVYAENESNFGAKNLATTGTVATGALTVTGAASVSARTTTAGVTTTGTLSLSSANGYITGNATTGVVLNNNADTINLLLLENSGVAKFINVGTTASAANAFLDSGASNSLLRSTSSIKYKTAVESIDPTFNKVLGLRPVWYRSLAAGDNPAWGFWGLIAEEVAAIDPKLVHYGYQEDQYETVKGDKGPEKRVKANQVKRPDGVQYERLTVLLLDVVQRQEKRIAALEAKLI